MPFAHAYEDLDYNVVFDVLHNGMRESGLQETTIWSKTVTCHFEERRSCGQSQEDRENLQTGRACHTDKDEEEAPSISTIDIMCTCKNQPAMGHRFCS